jgi:hypothetical protein
MTARAPLPSQPDREPTHAELADRIDALERAVSELRAVIGKVPSDGDPDGAGVAGAVATLNRTVGRAPNDATGDEGAGLARVVAELARQKPATGRTMLRASAVGGGGAVALATVLIELARMLGVFP